MQKFKQGDIIEANVFNDVWLKAKFICDDDGYPVIRYLEEYADDNGIQVDYDGIDSLESFDCIRPAQLICDEAREKEHKKLIIQHKTILRQVKRQCEELEELRIDSVGKYNQLKEKDAEIERLKTNQKDWQISGDDFDSPIMDDPRVKELINKLFEIKYITKVHVESMKEPIFIEKVKDREIDKLKKKLKKIINVAQ